LTHPPDSQRIYRTADTADTFDPRRFALLEQIARGDALPELLAAVVRFIEERAPAMLGSIVLIEDGCIRAAMGDRLPAAYRDALVGLPIGPSAGSCGTAAFRGQRVVVEDIDTDDLWADYRDLVRPYGLRACWSNPIHLPESGVVGTFAMYYSERRSPTDAEIRLIDEATCLAAVAIRRDRASRSLRESEARARQLARLYAVSSGVNEAIVRTRDPAALFDTACRLVVDHGFARLAWIGIREESGLLRPVARAGVDMGYVDGIVLDLNDAQTNRGPSERAFHTGAFAATNDIEADPDFFWKEEALERGLRSCGAFPIAPGGRPTGVFAVYAEQRGCFGDEELRVLTALAADISFALESIAGEDERRRLQRTLEASEARLRAVIEHTPNVAIQWYDSRARVLFSNRASRRMFGWTEGCELGKTLDQLNFPPGEAVRFAEAVALVRETGRPAGPIEFRFGHPVGGEGVLLSTIFEIPLAGEEFCCARMDVDLTEHRRLEEAARIEEKRRALVYGMVADVIFYLGVEDGPRYRFLSVNEAFLSATGLVESQVVGRLVDEVIPPPALPLVLAHYDEAIRAGKPVRWEEESRYPSGTKRGEVTVVPVVDQTGRCWRLVGTVHDVTERVAAEEERRRLEVQLQQAQRLQALGTLAGGIAHDFNNLLTAIRGYADVALEGNANTASVSRSVQEISRTVQRASDLVRRLLLFGRGEEPRLRTVPVPPLIHEAVMLVRAALKAPVEIRTAIAEDTWPVLGDPTQMHQALMNLVTNAAQAIGDAGGAIEVSCENVTLTGSDRSHPALAAGRYLRIGVRDSGRGMDEATISRVFEPFFTTKPPHEGTGLGLSVVHGIMKNHRGAVTAESAPGVGTTFHLFFPAADCEAPPPTPPRAESSRGDGARILFVDDDEELVYLACHTLTRLGCRVSGHGDATEALGVFSASPDAFDVVVTDTSMAGMSGPELIRAVRAIRPEVPVVLVSGYLRDEDVETTRRLGLGDVLLKPYTAHQLAEVIHQRIRESSNSQS
jgi:PAS domain S-box-containing protein